MKKNRLVGLIVVLGIILTQFFCQQAALAAQIHHLRLGAGTQPVRIVLDLSEPIAYQEQKKSNGLELIVSLPGMEGQLIRQIVPPGHPVLQSIILDKDTKGQSRLRILLRQPATARIYPLAAPARLVIDLYAQLEQKNTSYPVPGVEYTSWQYPSPQGPITAHIAVLQSPQAAVVRPLLAQDGICGLEKVSSMAARNQAIVAVNASYFEANGDIIGLLKADENWLSVYNDMPRSALGILPDGRAIIGQPRWQGQLILGNGKQLLLRGVNRHRLPEEDLVLYNSYFGSDTATDENGREFVCQNGRVVEIQAGNTSLNDGQQVISATGSAASLLQNVKVGDPLKIKMTLTAPWQQCKYILGAGPLLVKGGQVLVTAKEEDFGPDVANGRAPRTAVGIDAQGRIFLVTVDGRQVGSVGMTLGEMAVFMKKLGVKEALNLDGGGSTAMSLQGQLCNQPSDGRERPVGSALAFLPQTLALAKK